MLYPSRNGSPLCGTDASALLRGLSFILRTHQAKPLRQLMARILPACVAAVLCVPASAQDHTAELDKLFAWTSDSLPGCVCAVSQNGKMIFNKAYGSADLEKNVPLSTRSVFDAGSLTKQFVAAAVLLLAEEKRLALTDPVQRFIPELPNYGQPITVDHLLTHTSGIRDWTALQPLSASSADALTLVLRQRGLNFPPGEEWAYSNSGYVLLKEIVKRVSGMSFGQFAQKRLFDPLGMQQTRYADDPRELIRHRALAYEKEKNQWKLAVLLDNERGGGGALFSTPADLLIWNDALTQGKLGAFVSQKIQEPAKLNNGRKLGYARGLILDSFSGGEVIWHSGSASGYKSWLGRFPKQGLSIAFMCNAGDGAYRDNFAQRIFNILVPAGANSPAPTPADPPTANIPEAELQAKAGLYFSETSGDVLRLVVDRNRLRVAGGPALRPLTADSFKVVEPLLQFRSEDNFTVRFTAADQLVLTSLEGKKEKFRRARSSQPDMHQLQAFAGRYESTDLGAVLYVQATAEGLQLRLNHPDGRAAGLKPVDTDTFQLAMMFLRFLRDKNGKVVGLDYSNPVIRHVPFERKDS